MATFETDRLNRAEKTRRVWDLPVRLFHWALVAAVAGAFVTNRLGVAYFKYHVWCGYAVIVLVGFRVIWGFIGTRHARFFNFVRGPIETLRYFFAVWRGRERAYPGHNPLGALMVVALLLGLGAQAVLGLFANDQIVDVGPLYGYVSDSTSLRLTSLHRHLFYWIAGAIGFHVLAVLIHCLIKREKLVRAMVTGHKPAHSVGVTDAVGGSRSWLAAIVVALLIAALSWVVVTAPASVAVADF
jgi:cytochrome b